VPFLEAHHGGSHGFGATIHDPQKDAEFGLKIVENNGHPQEDGREQHPIGTFSGDMFCFLNLFGGCSEQELP
jgi:hypothetical protein